MPRPGHDKEFQDPPSRSSSVTSPVREQEGDAGSDDYQTPDVQPVKEGETPDQENRVIIDEIDAQDLADLDNLDDLNAEGDDISMM